MSVLFDAIHYSPSYDSKSRNMPSESPTEAPTSCRDLPKYVDGNLVSNEEWRMPADFVWEVSPFAFPPIVEKTKLSWLIYGVS